jgi:adenylate kinase
MDKKTFVVIILGPGGSGKGTQAQLLAEKFDLYHLETSEIIEKKLANAKKNDFALVAGKKYYLSEERKLRESGALMSPPLISFWVEQKIKELAKDQKGMTTSGSPRTVFEGKELIPLLKKLYGKENIRVIVLKISEKESIWRNSHRKTCELMRHPILYSPETAKMTKCPLDGSKLLVRKDDDPKIIKVRFQEYNERTYPLIDLFKKEGLKVSEINGEQSVEAVHKDILKVLK